MWIQVIRAVWKYYRWGASTGTHTVSISTHGVSTCAHSTSIGTCPKVSILHQTDSELQNSLSTSTRIMSIGTQPLSIGTHDLSTGTQWSKLSKKLTSRKTCFWTKLNSFKVLGSICKHVFVSFITWNIFSKYFYLLN